MKITKRSLCRGKGKIFQKLVIVEMSESSKFLVQATTADGNTIPSKLYPFRGDEYVLCLPILETSIVYTISEINRDGSVGSSYSSSVSYSEAKWRSRANYRIASESANAIKDYDQSFFYEQFHASVTECITSPKRWVLRGKIISPAGEAPDLQMKFLDSEGKEMGLRQSVYPANKIELEHSLSANCVEYAFSADIPVETKSVCIVALSECMREMSNFYVVEPYEIEGLCSGWNSISISAGLDIAYLGWLDRNRASKLELAEQEGRSLQYEPFFSVIVPLYNTPLQLFDEMLESVMTQSYGNWELILINSTVENEELTKRVRLARDSDKRVIAIEIEKNLGISGNTNYGIKVAKGDFVCFFDHDDLLEPNILYEYALALNSESEANMLYCDEDKLFEDGSFRHPYFKPDFSIDQLRNNNYICHMLTIRKTVLDEIAPIPSVYDGAQDHYMALRVAETGGKVVHVPKILYHWRATEGSTALVAENKSYATDAGIKAVQGHLDRLGVAATVSGYGRPFTYRVRYHIAGNPKVSIVIPTKDNLSILKRCVNSILDKTSYGNYEIILVENGSKDEEVLNYYKELESTEHSVRVVIWEGKTFNFSSIANYGVSCAEGEYVVLLNNDTEVLDEEWLEILVGICSRKEVGAVGPRLYYPDYTYQHAGLAVCGFGITRLFRNIPETGTPIGYFALEDMTRNVSAVTGACLVTRRDTFNEVGGFDESLEVAFNDVDFCLRLQSEGYLCVYTADTSLLHFESYSRGLDSEHGAKKLRLEKELSVFRERWASVYVDGDPYFNKNASQHEPWSCYWHLG